MFFRDAKACSDDRSAASFLAIIFISQFPVSLCLFSRKYSRQTRLILLRVGACPTFFVTVTPRRALSKRPGEKMATKCLLWIFFPVFDNRKKSGRFKILSALVNEKKRKKYYYLCNWHRLYVCFYKNNALLSQLFLFLNRQPISAFCSAPINNPSSRFCWHPFQETMYSGTFNPAWLICSFHNVYFFIYSGFAPFNLGWPSLITAG